MAGAVMGTMVCLGMLGALGASGAWAAQVNLCVPSTAGQPITSNGSATSCATGHTAVALPASSADQQTLLSILPHITFATTGVGGKPTIKFTGINVQVLNGSGSTASDNGEGNLVIGYDERPGGQTGSHNLVLGSGQAYVTYGSILAGTDNTVSGHSSVTLGYQNAVNAAYSSITGGRSGSATAAYSSIQGGYDNRATANYGAVAGGFNLAGTGSLGTAPAYCSTSGDFPEVTGGRSNQATGEDATVTGGQSNTASGTSAAVSGGEQSTASGEVTSISGGEAAEASAIGASVAGGYNNDATGAFASVSGGYAGLASGDRLVDLRRSGEHRQWWGELCRGRHRQHRRRFLCVRHRRLRERRGQRDTRVQHLH